MTSKTSFIDILTEDLKRRIWPIALSLVGFFFALPVLALIKLEDHINSLLQGWDTLISLRASFVHYTLGPNNAVAIAGLMIMASLNAIQGMKYLHNRQEADFYGSIPVLRTQKFSAAFINGILIGVVPYIIMQLIAAAIGASRGFVTGEGFAFAIQTMLFEITGFLLIYSVIVLAAILTGHTAVTVAGGTVLSFGLLAYATMIENYKSMYYITMYDQNNDYIYNFSPFTVFVKMLWIPDGARALAPYSYHLSNVITAAVCLLISVMIFVLSLKLIVIRPAEAAGRSMAFEKTKPFIKVFIMIPVIMTFGAFFPSLSNNGISYGWLIFGIVVGIILSHAAIEIIYEFDFKACVKNIPSGIVGAVITVIVVSFFVFDFSGYDTKLPDKGRIVSSAVYLPGLGNGTGLDSYYSDNYDYINNTSDSEMAMRGMVLENTDDVYTLAQAGCEYAMKYRMHGSGPAENAASGDNPQYIQVQLTLRKASGKAFKRSYYVDRDDSDVYSALERIYDTDEFKDNNYTFLTKDDEMYKGRLDYIQYETSASTETASDVSDADADRLLNAMKKDTRALTLDDLKEEAPLGYLSFELKNDNSPYSASSWAQTYVSVGYVYPSFTETLSILNEYGIRTLEKMEPEDISYIIEIMYDDDGNDISERIENRAEIARLMPELVDQNYASTNYAFFDVDYNSTYEVHFRSEQTSDGYDTSNIGYFVKKG
ncbi:MAG: hypothetical protein IJT24_04585 [Lachnospiraceae bacterium]|nr:hypothetical protein [Lachnospiraceae bacterium]